MNAAHFAEHFAPTVPEVQIANLHQNERDQNRSEEKLARFEREDLNQVAAVDPLC